MNQRDASSTLVVQPKMSYEEFRKQWYAKCPKDIELSEFVEISEFFCECDYKRYTGEWESDTL